MTTGFKRAARISYVLKELGVQTTHEPIAYNDNEANIEFVRVNNVAKGVSRHMELRIWYSTRDEYAKGNVDLKYIEEKKHTSR